jgi:hypothetical protein
MAAAQSRVRSALILLARPRACNPEECVTLFREAQGYLEWFRDSLLEAGRPNPDLRRQATILAVEIRQAGVLIEQAARFGRRWLERRRCMSPEYTAAGRNVPLDIRRRISFLG